jgi:SPP1 gp7 family putative phage head morphogenesis protein
MSKLSRAADRFRRQVLKREAQASSRLVQAYGTVYSSLSSELEAVTKQIIELQKSGETITENLIYQRTRLLNLLELVEDQIADFSRTAEASVTLTQAYAVEAAQFHASQLILTAMGPLPDGRGIPTNFTRFNPAAVEKLIGRSSNGSPLRELFASLSIDPKTGVSMPDKVQDLYVKGIVRGAHPTQMARELRDEFGVPLTRAQTISRTEVLNTYRETNREYFAQNTDVVERWRWQAAFQSRTCAMCLAMDGREFDTKVPMGSHPNCRCVLVPVSKSWAELGFGDDIPDTRPAAGETGEQWFAKQPEAVQLAILGPGKLERYKEGKLTLRDTVGYRNDSEWGPNRWERSLIQIDSRKHVQRGKQWGKMQES